MNPTPLTTIAIGLCLVGVHSNAAQESTSTEANLRARAQSHWAFQAVPAAPSQLRLAGIDYFIDSRLAQQGLVANDAADPYTLIRRATFDLTGLPPTPEEIDAFVRDHSPDAYARLIDRLLASPAYGERWGRYWLDLARYADTNGADENMAYPQAWRYRDYVIRSFNADKPYDQFIQEQLAGDLLPAWGDSDRDQDRIIATGFLAIGPKMLAEQDKEKMLIDIVDEQIDVVTKTFIGLTVSCARCHDHKFEAISQEDYFALAGVFRSTKSMANTSHVSRWVETVLDRPSNEAVLKAHQELVATTQQEITALEKTEPAAQREDQLKQLKERLQKLQTTGPMLPRAMAVTEGDPVDLPVHIRGDHLTVRETKTPRGTINLFRRALPLPALPPTQSGRLELAHWLTDPKHPLTARVMVNRIWQGHFGFGLVRSPSNFGLRGELPTHPDLLDRLAREFVESKWSVKHMHRMIMLSQAYRRSSHSHQAQAAIDPQNFYLWRQNRRRLEAEPLRDTLLFVSDQLDRSANQSLGALETNQDYYRADATSFQKMARAIYLPVVRANGYEMFATFDGADSAVHHEQRASTVVPSQALFMLNSDIANKAAQQLAGHLALVSESALGRSKLDDLFLRLFARPARPREIQLLGVSRGEPTAPEWERICRVLLSANEFVYVN